MEKVKYFIGISGRTDTFSPTLLALSPVQFTINDGKISQSVGMIDFAQSMFDRIPINMLESEENRWLNTKNGNYSVNMFITSNYDECCNVLRGLIMAFELMFDTKVADAKKTLSAIDDLGKEIDSLISQGKTVVGQGYQQL